MFDGSEMDVPSCQTENNWDHDQNMPLNVASSLLSTRCAVAVAVAPTFNRSQLLNTKVNT